MNVLVIGANGQIGRHLVDKLKEDSQYTPIAFVRKKEQVKDFEGNGVEARLGNLEASVKEIQSHFTDIDAVVFTAGSGGSTGYDKTLLIDLDGAVKVVEAAQAKGIKRFVMVSAMQADRRENWSEQIKPYYVAKHYADRYVADSGLHYTIVKPGGLLNEEPTGKVNLSDNLEGERRVVPREDVAEVVHQVLDKQNTFGKSFDLASGETPIEEAVKQL